MFTEDDRKLIWEKLSAHDYTIHNLKSIAQNPVEISKDGLYEWNNMINSFISDLRDIQIIVNT